MIPIATILAHNHHPTFQVYVAQNLFYPANLRERGVVVKKIRVFSQYERKRFLEDIHFGHMALTHTETILKQRRNMIL